MRYKVRAADDESYSNLLRFLKPRTRLYVASPFRRLLSTGDLPEETREEIRARGGQVVEERQYGPG